MELDLQRRSNDGGPPRVHKRVQRMQLPARQRCVLDVIVQYYRATQEPCPATLIARRLSVHHSTVQEHLTALYRKGWLVTANAPAKPTHY